MNSTVEALCELVNKLINDNKRMQNEIDILKKEVKELKESNKKEVNEMNNIYQFCIKFLN